MRVVLAGVMLLALCGSAHAVDGSGKPASLVREVGGFTAVECGGAFEVVIQAGKPVRCELSGDDNLLPLVTTVVKDGTLVVGTSEPISSTGKIKVSLDVVELKSVSIAGATSGSIDGVKGDAFALKIAGAAKVTVNGEAKAMTLDASGSAKVLADGLKTSEATLNCSGAVAVEVNASEKLAVDVSGAASVIYSGNPKSVEKNVSGVGRITPR